jgi:hypothetical protein
MVSPYKGDILTQQKTGPRSRVTVRFRCLGNLATAFCKTAGQNTLHIPDNFTTL